MQSDIDSLFRGGVQTGPSLAVELISPHARISGTVNLGAYTRLPDLLNFHDEILTVKDARILNRSGIATADGAPELDLRLDTLSLVLDHSDYTPPPDIEMIEKRAYRMLVVTEAHIITGTFFIYPGAEAIAYLRAKEPHWVPVADVRVRSTVDRRIKYSTRFAVLSRRSIVATAVA
jgi:hypothetical protein